MRLGFIGLGKMGANMALRLVVGSPDGSVKGSHQVVGFAKEPHPDLDRVDGISIVGSLEDLVKSLDAPRIVWVMVPAGQATESVISSLAEHLAVGDLIIDGGNSYYKDTVRRAQGLTTRGIGFVDVGTSGGIWGRQEGYCMMIGGQTDAITQCTPIFDTLAPQDGWAQVGPVGAGHFVKMVHNGIEYGLMEAYAEGFAVLHKSPFAVNLAKVASVWNHGSVIRSWLLELGEKALQQEANLESIAPFVSDSGEGRWTIQAAIDEDVAVPVIASALFARFASRNPENFSARFCAALRNQFGGHEIKRAESAKLQSDGTTH